MFRACLRVFLLFVCLFVWVFCFAFVLLFSLQYSSSFFCYNCFVEMLIESQRRWRKGTQRNSLKMVIFYAHMYLYVCNQNLGNEQFFPCLEPAKVPITRWSKDLLSLLLPQFLTWVWKNFCLLPPLCNFWESNSSWLYSACVAGQGMTLSL